VTIIVGFRCFDGVVVCADTQETVTGVSKKNVSKVRVENRFGDTIPRALSESDLTFAFCGSGPGPFIDMLTRRARKAAEACSSMDDASESVEKAIQEVYREYGQIYQVGQCPYADLIYGLKMHNESRLFLANGPVVNEQEEYCSSGAGYYMADFLVSRMRPTNLDVHQCALLAALRTVSS
jgi:hypothetical protein